MKRTFRAAPLVYKAEPILDNFSFTLPGICRVLVTVMGQSGFGPPFETSPSINEVVERFTHLENTLLQMQRSLDEVNYKFDLLLQHFNANHAPGYRDTSALESFTTLNGAGTSLAPAPRPFPPNAIAPSQILTQNGPTLDGEFGRPSASRVGA